MLQGTAATHAWPVFRVTPTSPDRFPAGPWRVLFLVLATALVWAAHYQRWTPEQWRLPTDYSGDAHETLARIRAAADEGAWPLTQQVVERLGAPFGAHWNAYPTPDKPVMMVLGALARQVGVYAAANAGLLLAQVASALAFYFVARWLRCRWEWAWAGAVLFAHTYHVFHRGLAHFSFVLVWTVPVGLLAVWLVAQSRRLGWRGPGVWVCGMAAVGMGVGNPYNLLFWGLLLGAALLAQWFGPRRRVNLEVGLAAGALAVATCVIANAELWLFVQEPDGLPLLARNYGGTERYALKPVEMLIPPQFHRWDWFAAFGQRYDRWSDWRGEAFLPYLGLVGIAGLLWLLGSAVTRLLRRRPAPGQALSLAWLTAYASVGGLTNVLAFFAGVHVFRATNRVATFVSALVLVFLMVRLSRLTAGWPRAARWASALALATVGVLDQLPRPPSAEARAKVASEVRSDAALGRALESALPPGSMVFQLPVLGFPEATPPFRLADYEHFRLYLATESLRFSYGAAKHRSRSRWQRDLESVPTATLVRRLERYGFAALHINRKGYEDRAERMLQELAALGYRRRLHGALDQQVVVLLNPSPAGRPPLGSTLTFGRGWHPGTEQGIRWANGDAVLSYFNPFETALTLDLSLTLDSVGSRQVTLEHEGRAIARVELGNESVALRVPQLQIPPGVNRFKLRSPEAAQRLSAGRYQLRSFGLRDVSLRIVLPSELAGALLGDHDDQ
jgi:phosphoglycerol transferase